MIGASIKMTENLPSPSTARSSPNRFWRRLPIVGLLGMGTLLTIQMWPSHAVAHTDGVEAYWNKIVGENGVPIMDNLRKRTNDHHDKCMTAAEVEGIYLGVPNNDSAAAASERISVQSHSAGTGWDFVTAIKVKNDWERALGLPITGYDGSIFDAGTEDSQKRIKEGGEMSVWIDTYYPLLNTPVARAVTLMTDTPFHAKLREDVIEEDPFSANTDAVPAFHGYSISGDVTGKIIYAGYGRKADFDLLQSKGVDFTGKIAFVKYGSVFRGLKVKAAQEAGAIGCIIFTDPGDDGEVTEANGYVQYPDGPARQNSSIQRGSVQFLSSFPGDPTTKDRPAYKDAERDPPGNLPSIPSLPMSYVDAIPLLKALEGKGMAAADVDPSFEGGLGFYGVKYFTGPSDVDVRLMNEVNTRIMPIWNTMALIPGENHNEAIIIGNHRDGWAGSAADPTSGTAAQHEMVRGLGELLKKGWKPKRSIIVASWDAEEYGLVGSTEWCEDFASWLWDSAAAYLNLDVASSGQILEAAASPTLAWLIRNAALQVQKEAATAWGMEPFEPTNTSDTSVAPLGSGSDYTTFLMKYGVASTDFSFGGGPKDAVYHYHSVYDSFTWLSKFGDPGFNRHVDSAKIIGLMALRLADTPILPFNTTQYARDLDRYLATVEGLKAANESFSSLDFGPLGESIKKLQAASAELDAHRAQLEACLGDGKCGGHGKRHNDGGDKCGDLDAQIAKVNCKLRTFEQGFISEGGIKDREWYKNKATAPGKWLGYGATTFPGVSEALVYDKDVAEAQTEADELVGMINDLADKLSA